MNLFEKILDLCSTKNLRKKVIFATSFGVLLSLFISIFAYFFLSKNISIEVDVIAKSLSNSDKTFSIPVDTSLLPAFKIGQSINLLLGSNRREPTKLAGTITSMSINNSEISIHLESVPDNIGNIFRARIIIFEGSLLKMIFRNLPSEGIKIERS